MPDRVREVRAIWGTTFNTSYIAANNAAWNPGTAHKLAVTSLDLSKLTHRGIESQVRRQRLYGRAAPIVGLADSELTIGMYLGRGSSTTTAPIEATLLSQIFGGLASPTQKTDTVEASSTTTTINATSHGMSAGMAVLVGTRGDGRGNGEVRRIATTTTNSFTLEMALPTAPSTGDALVYSHTVYLDQSATQSYLDLLILGIHAEDQIQCLGCMGPATLKGLAPGEVPEFELALTVADWQEVPAGERASLTPGTSAEGDGSAPASKGLGGCYLGDWGSTTRATIESAAWAVNPGIAFERVADRNGLNGIGGYRRSVGVPTAEMSIYVEEDYGIHADFTSSTAKQLTMQFGASAQNCVAITLPRVYLSNKPTRTQINNIAALKLEMHAEEPTVASTPVNLYSSACAIHWF